MQPLRLCLILVYLILCLLRAITVTIFPLLLHIQQPMPLARHLHQPVASIMRPMAPRTNSLDSPTLACILQNGSLTLSTYEFHLHLERWSARHIHLRCNHFIISDVDTRSDCTPTHRRYTPPRHDTDASDSVLPSLISLRLFCKSDRYPASRPMFFSPAPLRTDLFSRHRAPKY